MFFQTQENVTALFSLADILETSAEFQCGVPGKSWPDTGYSPPHVLLLDLNLYADGDGGMDFITGGLLLLLQSLECRGLDPRPVQEPVIRRGKPPDSALAAASSILFFLFMEG